MFVTAKSIILACAALGALAGATPDHRSDGGARVEFVQPTTYEITQRISVVNRDVSALDMLELNLPVPIDWPEQTVKRLNVSGDNAFQLYDIDGMGLIARSRYVYPRNLPAPGMSRTLEVRYLLTRSEIRSDKEHLAHRVFKPYDKESNEYRIHIRTEPHIEVDAPEIVRLATRFRSQSASPYQRAKNAYDYVIDHIEYATPSPSHGALECLQKGKADCGSYALLFVALCRASGVPARPVVGCWASGDNQWHCWAEFLLPGVGWIPVDPTAGERSPHDRSYYFGNLDSNRVALAKTFNFTVKTDRGSTELGFVQVGTWWWYPSPGSTGAQMDVTHYLHGVRVSAPTRP